MYDPNFEQELKNLIVHLGWVKYDGDIWMHERSGKKGNWKLVVKYILAHLIANRTMSEIDRDREISYWALLERTHI